ncbi:cytoskeletal protein [Schizosaccharomyces japonicus yFS275]|uniref:Cytoskeletal protein n=1 Tax=Schizosaccharomyces japonicus (strain yFS275 / FY16936) TaxID=402676 RepID=B6K1W5_SCHJY|nr:cytoskeletal protein [Schizosaccharomyces japonicus yFS275]EEB07146.1 cytoskeletal protein [Schizosaccharomyces japonicus yFS275]
MEISDVLYQIDDKKQFLSEVDEIVNQRVSSKEQLNRLVDNLIRFICAYGVSFLTSEEHLLDCCLQIRNSATFKDNVDVFRSALLATLFASENIFGSDFVLYFFLVDASKDPACLHFLADMGFFPLLIDHIVRRIKLNKTNEESSCPYGLCLLVRLCRTQRISMPDLKSVSDFFMEALFLEVDLAKENEIEDHFILCILAILSLNEQFMLAGLRTNEDPGSVNGHANKVMAALMNPNIDTRSYGEGLVFTLNRENDVRVQLLILKQLFLIFTTPETYEYFYTNDLHVLMDVCIRELNNLSPESSALQYAYLQVLYPMLVNSQVRDPPHYKTVDLVHTLQAIVEPNPMSSRTIPPATEKAVEQVLSIPWLQQAN